MLKDGVKSTLNGIPCKEDEHEFDHPFHPFELCGLQFTGRWRYQPDEIRDGDDRRKDDTSPALRSKRVFLFYHHIRFGGCGYIFTGTALMFSHEFAEIVVVPDDEYVVKCNVSPENKKVI